MVCVTEPSHFGLWLAISPEWNGMGNEMEWVIASFYRISYLKSVPVMVGAVALLQQKVSPRVLHLCMHTQLCTLVGAHIFYFDVFTTSHLLTWELLRASDYSHVECSF